MLIATGTVIDGKVVVEGVNLREGATVTVLVRHADELIDLTGEEEAELLAASDQARRGETISGDEFLASLRQPPE
ncbi:hypothetical protein [Rugamonas sp.]|uniref:hypothetical protein n=1 Tax=Rugamonas sp. TaxID=1926287 RepID=UPI0025E9B8EA|nr:hypothetical protein [Rugamonas sp.]